MKDTLYSLDSRSQNRKVANGLQIFPFIHTHILSVQNHIWMDNKQQTVRYRTIHSER